MTTMPYEKIFFTGLTFTYILVTAIILGLGGENVGTYLSKLNYFMKLYVCIIIIVRFNPFTQTRFTKFDQRLVFTSAIFLLSTTTIEEIMEYITDLNPFVYKQ